ALLRTLIVIAATFCVIVLIGSSVTQRFTQMIDTSEQIVRGDLSQRIQIGGQDELSRMATQFNCVVDALELKIDEVTELNRSLENRV
ncbi:HAMP domain-containing protein, partial [Vibrio parahaemolyticus]|uniref:HAMP domain-containing protein n=1 Tax=Vibrio parahaemolyticus TaxID=670 RepID=UPI0021156FF8